MSARHVQALTQSRTKRCTGCNEHHPLEAFLSSPFTPDGFTDKCLAAIRRAAQRDREAREQRYRPAHAKAEAEPITKACRSCKKPKPFDQFTEHRLAKDGHRHNCKACVKAQRAKRGD